MQINNDSDVNREERYLNWIGLLLICAGVFILLLVNVWVAVGVIFVVVGNNYRQISVLRAGMRHLAKTTVESFSSLIAELRSNFRQDKDPRR